MPLSPLAGSFGMSNQRTGTDSSGDWVDPSPCVPASSCTSCIPAAAATGHAPAEAPPPLTAEQVAQWRTQGFVVVDDLWPASLCAQALEEIDQYEANHPDQLSSMLSQNLQSSSPTELPARATDVGVKDGASAASVLSPFAFNNPQRASIGAPLEFPSVCPAINAITLHPRIIAACRQLLDHEPSDISSVRLLQSQLLTRTGPPLDERSKPSDLFTNSYGQRIHPDYPNNSLLVHSPPHLSLDLATHFPVIREETPSSGQVPPSFNTPPEAVQALLYLSNVQDVGGTTAVVPCAGEDDEAY